MSFYSSLFLAGVVLVLVGLLVTSLNEDRDIKREHHNREAWKDPDQDLKDDIDSL